MRFLVDECVGPAVASWLRKLNHEVFSIYEEARGLSDDEVLNKAFQESWILITSDKGFGEKVFREHRPHKGIVVLRLDDERTSNKLETLNRLLEGYSDQLSQNFVVATEKQVRIVQT